ncbi:MAG: hypothetical protein EB079_00215 [Verrucomicrobia bacterium]|nr:hypothetical protein [Verrucomicrobiota bacterium]
MIREINLLPWKTVVVTSDFDKSEIKNIMLILAEIDNCYYYLEEWDEKIFDISQMPNYIKMDWLNYNKKPLSLKLLNKQVKNLLTLLSHQSDDVKKINQLEEEIYLIKSLRRDLIIKGAISN